jgi:pimeloyl-ACP methyl ester carboxylesterase
MQLMLRLLFALVLALAGLFAVVLVIYWAPDKPVAQLSERWAKPPSRFIPVMGMQVHVRDEGPRDDPLPLVLLHGTSASLHTWDGWVTALKGQRRVIRMDLPGFGLTGPNASNDYTIESYTAFVVATLDSLGVQQFVLGGNSLGGYVAWSTAVAAPGRVKQLILVDSAGYALQSLSVPIGFRIARVPVLRNVMEWVLPRSVIVSSLHNVYGDPLLVTDVLVDRYYDMALREGNRKALARRMEQGFEGNEEAIKTLQLPTLILWGAKDRLIPLSYGQRFSQDIKGSRLIIFDDLGHVPHEENALATVLPVKEFLGLK